MIANRTAVMISDLHVGDPETGHLEDFDRDDDFRRLLLEIIPQRAGAPSTLIIAGDFIDFPQVHPHVAWHSLGERYGVTENQSLDKIKKVINGHPVVFSAMEEFIHRGGQILMLPGNHDIDLHWPSVLGALHTELGSPDTTRFQFVKGGTIHEQGVYIEHGNQYSYDNWFEHWNSPIVSAPDGERIERPWGTFFMDLVYNDLEEAYPFINKVYPHGRLAWIALRSFRDKENVSSAALARLVAFFLTKGKYMIGQHILGNEQELREDSVRAFVERLGDGADPARIASIVAEAERLLATSKEPKRSNTSDEPITGLLGHNDTRGLRKRAQELQEHRDATVVAFGHTHHAVAETPYGDDRHVFNTGSWMPSIELGAKEQLRWSDLKAKTWSHDVRYLWIELGGSPRASLETFPAVPTPSTR